MPLEPGRYLVVVAGAAEEPTLADARVFLAAGQQGVSLHAGVWHHALLALDRESDVPGGGARARGRESRSAGHRLLGALGRRVIARREATAAPVRDYNPCNALRA